MTKADSARYISHTLEVKGEVERILTLNVDSLKQMNTQNIEHFKVVCQSGATMKENASCKGVLL
ncbi:MAG: hypothetical protein IT240_06980, partial [Bacteroidia bacterium]|nr:hypothetical protein [Bacteroidia bacterium]